LNVLETLKKRSPIYISLEASMATPLKKRQAAAAEESTPVKATKKTQKNPYARAWVALSPEAKKRFENATSTKEGARQYLIDAGIIAS